jgi:hypothetical protein
MITIGQVAANPATKAFNVRFVLKADIAALIRPERATSVAGSLRSPYLNTAFRSRFSMSRPCGRNVTSLSVARHRGSRSPTSCHNMRSTHRINTPIVLCDAAWGFTRQSTSSVVAALCITAKSAAQCPRCAKSGHYAVHWLFDHLVGALPQK